MHPETLARSGCRVTERRRPVLRAGGSRSIPCAKWYRRGGVVRGLTAVRTVDQLALRIAYMIAAVVESGSAFGAAGPYSRSTARSRAALSDRGRPPSLIPRGRAPSLTRRPNRLVAMPEYFAD